MIKQSLCCVNLLPYVKLFPTTYCLLMVILWSQGSGAELWWFKTRSLSVNPKQRSLGSVNLFLITEKNIIERQIPHHHRILESLAFRTLHTQKDESKQMGEKTVVSNFLLCYYKNEVFYKIN